MSSTSQSGAAFAAATPESKQDANPEATSGASEPSMDAPPDSADVTPPSESRPVLAGQAVARVALRSRAEASAKPRPAVLLVDGDRLGRTALARALVRAQWDVTPVDSVDELVEALRSDEHVRAALVDVQHPSSGTIFTAIASVRADLFVVVRTADDAGARSMMTAAGLKRFDVRPREAPAEDLLEALRLASTP